MSATRVAAPREETEQPYCDAAYNEYILAELDKSVIEANDPNIKRLTHKEVMAGLTRQREARARV